MTFVSLGQDMSVNRHYLATVVAIPLSIAAAYLAVKMHSNAAAACIEWNAGDGLGMLVVEFPAVSVAVWAAFSVPVLLLRRYLLHAAIAGLVCVAAVLYWYESGTPALIREGRSVGPVLCPDGIAPGWPTWLDR
jgi:hypothetical protein